jgi:predicted transcriptional regulator
MQVWLEFITSLVYYPGINENKWQPHMKLKEYLEKNRIEPVIFAVKCGISVTSLYRYLRGSRPHLRTAAKIERMTQKNVTVEELRGVDDRE